MKDVKVSFKIIYVITLSLLAIHAMGQTHIMFDNEEHTIPEGIVDMHVYQGCHDVWNFLSKSSKFKAERPVKYKYGKKEHYTKVGENGKWELYNTSYYDYNDFGNIIKDWDVGMDFYTSENNYSLYFYDEHNRNNKIEHYFDNGTEGVSMHGYHIMEYLDDFPEIESSILYYTSSKEWDRTNDDWTTVWKIFSGTKRDYTISKKIANHYEKKVDYSYNSDSQQWEVSGYKYDYVLNNKGQLSETLVYRATSENENKWPLILHVKNLINDNGVVFRSDRINYQSTTPYIERWSSILWEKHDGNMPISGYPVQGSNKIASAKIEFLVASNPSSEYAPCRFFSSEYQNDNSFHYIVKNSEGDILIDNSYFYQSDYSIQELWQGDYYQMQYYDFDDHNWATYDHNVQKQFYEGDNVITQRDWHRYTNNEYYKNTDELVVSEHYEYDALTDTEPFSRDRIVYSDYREYQAGINSIISDTDSQRPIYYNLQGAIVRNPYNGQLLIRKIGNTVDKIIYND